MSTRPDELSQPIGILTQYVAQCIERIRTARPNDDLIREKNACERAIRLLQLAERLSLTGSEAPVAMPNTTVATPSSWFRVVEDNETDDRALWTEVEIEGKPIRLEAGDVLLLRKG